MVTVADDGAPLVDDVVAAVVAPVGASAGFELRHPMAQSGQMRNQFQTNVRAKVASRALERAARGEKATVEQMCAPFVRRTKPSSRWARRVVSSIELAVEGW